jgi:hypothetical protein
MIRLFAALGLRSQVLEPAKGPCMPPGAAI